MRAGGYAEVTDVRLQFDGPVAWLVMDHPPRHNALTRASLTQFTAHLQALATHPEVRVLVLTGAGDRTFCAGLSLDEIRAGELNEPMFQALADRLAALPLPKIAAMNGSAYGGGVELGLCCDFRLGVEGMRVRVPAASIGLCYPPAGIRRYVSRLGVDAAKRLLVAAEAMDTPQLLRIGYLQEACPAAALRDRVDALARHLAGLAPLSVRAMLQVCDAVAEGRLDDEQATAWAERCNASEDLHEGLEAVLAKRPPEFRGR